MWSYFEALGILKKDFKYDDQLYMWWKPKKGRMDRYLRPLYEDMHAWELVEYAENIKEEVEIYVNHLVRFDIHLMKLQIIMFNKSHNCPKRVF